jgi:flagellar protein FliO/FliZ
MQLRSKLWIATCIFVAYGLTGLATAADVSAKPAAAPMTANPWGMLWGLFFLVVLVIGAWWLVKRMGGLPMQINRHMKVLGALSVGTRERVVLVDVGGEQLLLGVAPGRVNMLHRFEQPIVASDASAGTFADKIRQVMQQVPRQ